MTTTVKAPSAVETYLNDFREQENALCAGARPAVTRLRRAAIARFGEVGFPGERNEDWKFTSVAPIVRTRFELPTDPEATRPAIRTGKLPAGVIVTSMSEALRLHPDLVEPHLGQVADSKGQPFVALNTAFWTDGTFIYVPPGVAVEEPIQLDCVVGGNSEEQIEREATIALSGRAKLWYRRALVVLGRGSQATTVETFTGPKIQYMTNALCEVVLADGARLDHYKVQEESPQAFHIACTQAVLARDSNFSTHYIGLGGQLSRNEARVVFTGENGEATVNGLYLASGSQHADNFTVIDHARPHCASHELYKGILDGKAKGVFNGKIFVRPQAQKTDAKQTNQTLLLSDDATINTKPQLEIFADDVKCTHGATVGQLDEQQLFYLRARGIGLEQARALLTFAFANDIVTRIKVPALRDRLEQSLLASRQLPRLAEIEDMP
jgi:Fe-S cluster assembly protein SufD